MARKASMKSPVAFEGKESLAEEKLEQRMIKRSGSTEKAMEATEARKMRGGRQATGRR